jgi:hypothetical protein
MPLSLAAYVIFDDNSVTCGLNGLNQVSKSRIDERQKTINIQKE